MACCCNIAIGEVSRNVSQLQMYLQAVGLYQGYKVDSQYGALTKEAVRQYQVRHGLVADGWAGCITTGHMQLECATINCGQSYTPTPPNPTPVGVDPIYLQPSLNCPSKDPYINQVSFSICNGKSGYDEARKIFNFVRDKVAYEFYYNTKYGAINTLKGLKGNCTDQAHAVIALSRATGIPGRYRNLKAKFSSGGIYGHVVAELYVNGAWVVADPTNNGNEFGKVTWVSLAEYGRSASISF